MGTVRRQDKVAAHPWGGPVQQLQWLCVLPRVAVRVHVFQMVVRKQLTCFFSIVGDWNPK